MGTATFFARITAWRPQNPGFAYLLQVACRLGRFTFYAQMLIRLQQDIRPDHVVVAFDHKGKTFRDELYSEYKANRSAAPDDLVAQLPHFRRLTEAFSWPVVSVEGFEADDVIADDRKRGEDTGPCRHSLFC